VSTRSPVHPAPPDVRRHSNRPKTLFATTTAPGTDGVTIETVNEAVVNGADVSNLVLNLADTARSVPAHPAAVTDAATMTYADLHAESSRFATLLQRNGIGAGDRVGVMLPNTAAAVLSSGATVDPQELRAFAKRRVAAYKYPRRIWLVDSLPTGPTGELLRRDVIPPPEEV